MISGISKKVIFFSFLFINFLQPSKSADFVKINKNINNRNTKLIWSKSLNKENLSSSSKVSYTNTSSVNLQKNLDSSLVANAEEQRELIIQSDTSRFKIQSLTQARM